MVRWSDLGASLHASPRAVLRWDLWREVLRRALFSRVFAGYLLGGLLLVVFLVGGAALSGLSLSGLTQSTGLTLLVMVMMAAPGVLLLAGVLLLPYLSWSFSPVAARVLQDYLHLPPAQVDEEPRFRQHLLWTTPLLLLCIVLAIAYLLPVLHQGAFARAFEAFALVLMLLSTLKLFARGSLASHFARHDVDLFLAATRWQRLILWVPAILAVGWLAEGAANGLVAISGLEQGPEVRSLFAGWLLRLLVQLALSSVIALAFTGMLLLACARLAVPPETMTAVATDVARGDAQTRPMTEAEIHVMRRDIARRPAPSRSLSRRLVVPALVLATAGAVAYLARMPLTDWYFSHDAVYARAADIVQGQQPQALRRAPRLLQADQRAERLRAGYIVYGCTGEFERAQWLRWLGAPQDIDHSRLLACAACTGAKSSVNWLLGEQPTLRFTPVVIATDSAGRQERTALSCAARANDMALARQLMARGASPRELRPPHSALHVAAAQQHWDMVRLLLQKDPGAAPAATFAALDAAFARDPRKPAEVLPRMLGAGLSLQAVDRNDRNLFHWAASRHDLALAQGLLQRAGGAAEQALLRRDRHGALPWMLVLRKSELDGRPLSADAAELLKLLLPPDVDVNAVLVNPDSGGSDPLPAGWNAGSVAINDARARDILGPSLDFGLLPQDASAWWKFIGEPEAQAFVRSATPAQLLRAENPDAPVGLAPKKLSAALSDAGWQALADEVQAVVKVRRR